MKKINFVWIVAAMFAMSGCSVVGDIFKAGYYVGIIVVVVVLLIIFWLVSMFRNKG